jgi:hypothetical protein
VIKASSGKKAQVAPPPTAPMMEPQEAPLPSTPQNGDMEMGGGDMPMETPMPEEPVETPMDDMNPSGGDDKKKEIQKLAGELSELLHTYNEENGEDEELNKYVKGMIDAQTDGESEENDDVDEPDMDDEMPNDEPQNDEPSMDEPNPEETKMEGRKFSKKQLKEEFAQMANQSKTEKNRTNKKLSTKKVNKDNPFTPPMFN